MKYTTTTLVALLLFTSCTPALNDDHIDHESLLSVTQDGYTSIDADELRTHLAEESAAVLNEKEIESLLYMREEEKLARDVYLTLYEQWGLKPHQNISASEQTHTDAVAALLEKYDINDPASETAGVFTNDTLQQLYDDVVEKGSASNIAALEVGALVEEVDIIDITDNLTFITNEDIIVVYQNLLRGSRNHLRAYVRNLDKQGVSYAPQMLDQETFDLIIGSDMEQGAGHDHENRVTSRGNGRNK